MGGGVIIVPTLVFLGLDIKTAIGISVFQMVFASMFGSYLNFKKATLNLNEGFVIGAGGFIGALFSGYILSVVPSALLEWLFLGIIVFAIYRYFTLRPSDDTEEKRANPFALLGVGISTGAFAISLGVGGAILLNPILVGFLKFTIRKTVALTLFYVAFSSFAGVMSMAYYGHLNYTKGAIVAATSMIGVFIGVNLAQKTEPKRHKSLMLLLYIVMLFVFIDKLFL